MAKGHHKSIEPSKGTVFSAILASIFFTLSTMGKDHHKSTEPSKGTAFSAIIASKDYRLKKHEFTEFIVNENLGVTKEQAEAMFEHADSNGNGYLSANELAAVVDAVKDSAMALPVRMIVPSTQDVSGKISEAEMKMRCDQVISFMSATFGGATASAIQRGAYRADSGEIIFEEVQSVTSFCTQALWEEHVEMVRGKVAEFCDEWGQECIGLEFAGFLEYIYSTPPSPDDLWTSVVSRLRKRRQLGWQLAAETTQKKH